MDSGFASPCMDFDTGLGVARRLGTGPLAESEGFEPSVPVTQHGSLANCWFQPLTHDSEPGTMGGYNHPTAHPQPHRPMPMC